jgi:putative Holliday junction resolvase
MIMKIIALDIGDAWTGIAISDLSGIIARPYTTIASNELITYLQKLFSSEKIKTAVIGNPITMKGLHSEQTKRVGAVADTLKATFPDISWILWDERLTSKQAEQFKKNISKEEKLKSHARAAALILERYLAALHFALQNENPE